MAIEEARSTSAREGAIYAYAHATRSMAAAHMKKAVLLADQNMVLLMTMPDEKITTEAREYLRLRRWMSSRSCGGNWQSRRTENAPTQLRWMLLAHPRPQNVAASRKGTTTSTRGWVRNMTAEVGSTREGTRA